MLQAWIYKEMMYEKSLCKIRVNENRIKAPFSVTKDNWINWWSEDKRHKEEVDMFELI